jgi:hypothetical protein
MKNRPSVRSRGGLTHNRLCVYGRDLYRGKCAARDAPQDAIAIVDEDQSPLSLPITNAFYPPLFMLPEMFTPAQMDAGVTTFALDIPPNFQRDMLAGRKPAIQLNVDATRIGQALTATHMCRQ